MTRWPALACVFALSAAAAAAAPRRLESTDYFRMRAVTSVQLSPDGTRAAYTVQTNDGRTIALDTSKPQAIEHGYCSTIHSAQGQTCDRVLIDADTRSAAANESAYYVAISRAREDVRIYTDDKAMLPEAMSRLDAKSAALEIAPPQERELALGG